MTDSMVGHRNAEPLVEKSDLVNQISHGPTLNDVASHLLRRMLTELYPDLDIDPDLAFVGSPQWPVIDDQLAIGLITYESLTHTLVRNGLFGTIADYIEGEHFLTLQPQADDPVQLAVDIERIALTLNEAVALLFIDFQDRQLSFWNQKVGEHPRWQKLSDSLRRTLNVKQVNGWDTDECAMAREIYSDPDRATRSNGNAGFSPIQACLLDIDVIKNNTARHLVLAGALVIKATYRERQLLIMYTIERGYESFGSLGELGSSLPERLDQDVRGWSLEWRLFEPDGNVFDYIASALVSSQIDNIDLLGNAQAYTDTPASDPSKDDLDKSRFKQLDAAIPDWLRSAPANDLDDYRRYITALGKLYRKPKYRVARSAIPSISHYAHQLMRDAIIADKTAIGAATLPWDDLRIDVTNSFTVDNFTLPNPHDQYSETLAGFALENTAPYRASLSFDDDTPVPDWLTPAFLTRIAARVDVGSAYPSLLKKKLIDDKTSAQSQANLYRDQLRWLLPIKALEGKIKHEAGLDEQGYQFICTWLESAPGPLNPIAIYPLAMTPQHRLISSTDSVSNMFIISPRHASSGPCLLYRPMQDVPLMQFPSRQNLLYALHQPGELRESVLAWLPGKSLSFEYSQYVFPVGLPSPWLAAEQLVNPLLRAARLGRVRLAFEEISGDVPTVLFRKNAQALITLADRQSQSNAERRWTLLKDSSWALFSVTSNFLSGAVGTAVWAWQVIEQLQQALDAHEQGNSFIEWKSETDILLALGILLSHHAVARRKSLLGRRRVTREPVAQKAKPTPANATIKLDSNSLIGELPALHDSLVEADGVVPRRTPEGLGKYLDTLKVAAPDLEDKAVTRSGEAPPYLHHFQKKTYANVGERWFTVSVSEEGIVQIIHPERIEENGPLLASDADGRWVLDLRLRLRGGGPKNRIKALKAANELRKKELADKLDLFQRRKARKEDTDFEGSEEQQQNAVAKAQADYFKATDETREQFSAIYLTKVESMISAYQEALAQLREWHTLGGGASYQSESLRMHTEFEKYLSQWFFMKKLDYARLTLDLRSEQLIEGAALKTYVDKVQQTTDLSQAMVEKLVLSRRELERMTTLGRPGVERATALRKLSPFFTEWEIKANELGIAQELCIEELASATMTQARDDLGDQIVRAARVAHRIAKFLKKVPNSDTPKQQIEEIGQLIDTLADVDQRFQELPETYPGHFKQARLDHVRGLVNEFAAKARDLRLSMVEEDPSWTPPPVAGPSRQAAPRPLPKVKKTRPRQQPAGESAPVDNAPIGAITLDARHRSVPVQSDREIISDAFKLFGDAKSFTARTLKDATRPSRDAVDMQEIFDQQARKLEQSATSVDQVLARTHQFPVRSLAPELRAAAAQMRESGLRVRASLYKLRKPTQSMFRWMHDNRQLVLTREHGRIKTRQMGDYFQEYKILDAHNKKTELWVAHFHYANAQDPLEQPTTAHLKVSEAYLKTLTTEQQQTLTTFEPIDGFLRKIENPDLRKLFFDLEPKAAADTTP